MAALYVVGQERTFCLEEHGHFAPRCQDRTFYSLGGLHEARIRRPALRGALSPARHDDQDLLRVGNPLGRDRPDRRGSAGDAATLYRHFPRKEDLVLAYPGEVDRAMRAQVDDAVTRGLPAADTIPARRRWSVAGSCRTQPLGSGAVLNIRCAGEGPRPTGTAPADNPLDDRQPHRHSRPQELPPR